jgi:hypothetical protein
VFNLSHAVGQRLSKLHIILRLQIRVMIMVKQVGQPLKRIAKTITSSISNCKISFNSLIWAAEGVLRALCASLVLQAGDFTAGL